MTWGAHTTFARTQVAGDHCRGKEKTLQAFEAPIRCTSGPCQAVPQLPSTPGGALGARAGSGMRSPGLACSGLTLARSGSRARTGMDEPGRSPFDAIFSLCDFGRWSSQNVLQRHRRRPTGNSQRASTFPHPLGLRASAGCVVPFWRRICWTGLRRTRSTPRGALPLPCPAAFSSEALALPRPPFGTVDGRQEGRRLPVCAVVSLWRPDHAHFAYRRN